MGDPRRPRRTFTKPRSPWRSDQLAQELYLLGIYGLRNKRELWKAQTELSGIRKQARRLLAASELVRNREEQKLIQSLLRKGLVGQGVTLDEVLTLSVEDMLSRRLQTIVYRNGGAVSPMQARQLIVHRHVKIGTRIVSVPGYPVKAEEERSIQITGGIGTPRVRAPEPAHAEASAPTAPEAPSAPGAAPVEGAPAEQQQQEQPQPPSPDTSGPAATTTGGA
jgi:small subunit ribosomal protein S4